MGKGIGDSFLAGILTLVSCCLMLASPAAANPVLKAGTAGETSGGFCAPSLVTPSYSQQSAGVEPKVNDVFYLSLRIDLSLITFDCANEFYSVMADLPPNVQTAIGGSATTICRRWGTNANGQQVNDQRAQANCQANPAVNGNGEFSMRPVASPVLPDVGGGAGSFWFAGIRSPQESQVYDHVQLLVPIKATATMGNQPVGFVVCATGSSCVNVSVPLTVTAGPAPADPPSISLPAAAQTTAVGARLPFTINDSPTGSSYYLRLDAATSPTFASGRPCGLTGQTYFAASTSPLTPYSGSITSDFQWGDLQTGGTTCYLSPDTNYYVEVCTANPGTAFPWAPFAGCRTTQFTTGAVSATLALPTDPPFPVAPVAAVRVLGGHPAGTVKVQAKRWADNAASFADASTPAAVAQSTSDSPISNQAVSGLGQWRSYNLRACFISGAHQPCSTAIEYTTGHATTRDAVGISHEAATLSGLASSPNPALSMAILTSTTDPGAADPRQVMSVAGSGSTEANATTSENPETSVTINGLEPETTYFWTACFNNSAAQPALEDCGEVKSFTTEPLPDFCTSNPTNPTCTPDPCDDTPRPESCDPPPARASLSIGKVPPLKVKRGASGKLRVPVRNTSTVAATAVKLCPALPGRFKGRLKLPACRNIGGLATGRNSTVVLTVKAPKRSRLGVVSVRLALSWTEGSRNGSAKVTIRK
jgi:hypothetical protein